MAQSKSASLARFVFQDLLGSVLYFPIWWFTHGYTTFVHTYLKFVGRMQHRLAVGMWIRNIFTPMYGQYDVAGRIISFLMRSFQIFFRGIAFLIVLIVSTVAAFVWVILPGLATFALVAQVVGLFF